MTVARLEREMPYREMVEWAVRDKIKNEPPKMAAEDIFAAFDKITGFKSERGN